MTINPSDAVYALLSFFIMPPLVSFLTAHNANGAVKGLVVSLLSIGSGIGVTLLAGDFNPADASKTILIIVVSAAASYKLILHDFADTFGAIGLQLGKPKDPASVDAPAVIVEKKEV